MASRRVTSLEAISLAWGDAPVESVAAVLERTTDETIAEWYRRLESVETIQLVPLSFARRTAHLPQVFHALAKRLRRVEPLSFREAALLSAARYGAARRQQGYTAAMMVEESRMLQVCIFLTLQNHRKMIDPENLLFGVMMIADEVDLQLGQALESYIAEANADGLPG